MGLPPPAMLIGVDKSFPAESDAAPSVSDAWPVRDRASMLLFSAAKRVQPILASKTRQQRAVEPITAPSMGASGKSNETKKKKKTKKNNNVPTRPHNPVLTTPRNAENQQQHTSLGGPARAAFRSAPPRATNGQSARRETRPPPMKSNKRKSKTSAPHPITVALTRLRWKAPKMKSNTHQRHRK